MQVQTTTKVQQLKTVPKNTQGTVNNLKIPLSHFLGEGLIPIEKVNTSPKGNL